MKKTKKQYKELLNQKYGFVESNTHWSKKAKARDRLYGDYVYNSDREYFDVHYQIWLETGEF
jgi:hypothetical protein